MPLASVANLSFVMETTDDQVRGMLGALRRGGWVTSVLRGMTERRQHRWFLTRRAVDLLYVTDHQHPAPREEARATSLAAFHPQGELPQDFQEQFALDHDHPAYLENQESSSFNPSGPVEDDSGGVDHEHPPLDRNVSGSGNVPAPPGDAGAGLPPGPRPAAQRQGQPAVRGHRRQQGRQDDRLPAAPPRRLLPRRGPLR